MDLHEARKQVQAPKKSKENFMVIHLAYDFSIVLPHKDGIAFISAMANAEQMDPSYSSRKQILPLDRTKITASQMSYQEYERCKVAQLLGISYGDLERMEEEELQKDKEPPTP